MGEAFYDVLEIALGSPEALLRLHRFLLLEAAAALVLLPTIPVFFVTFGSPNAEELLLLIVLVPLCVTAVRVPVLLRLERRCRQLAHAFEARSAAVATGMVQLLRSTPSRHMQASSLCLIIWYSFCVFWNYIGPPCKDIA